jgi:hypothetical protein
MAHAGIMADELELAIQRVQEALDRVKAAWQVEHPDLPFPTEGPKPPAWHPDPNQPPVTTRQWAEITRLRASSLRRDGAQAYERALRLHRMTQTLHAFLRRPPDDHDPGQFIRVGQALPVPGRADAAGSPPPPTD